MPASVAVGILTLLGEEETTTSLVRGIAAIDDPDVTVHVLVNGGDEATLADVAELPRMHVRSVPENLGVAAGRNRLVDDAAFAAANIVGFLDNDLIVFDDLFDRLREASATHDGAAAIGVALFDHAAFNAAFPNAVSRDAEGGPL